MLLKYELFVSKDYRNFPCYMAGNIYNKYTLIYILHKQPLNKVSVFTILKFIFIRNKIIHVICMIRAMCRIRVISKIRVICKIPVICKSTLFKDVWLQKKLLKIRKYSNSCYHRQRSPPVTNPYSNRLHFKEAIRV